MKKRLVAIGVAIALAGCAVRTRPSKALVTTEIQQRTGHQMRPPGERVRGDVPPGVEIADGVTEDEAVALALWNNAALSADLSALGLAQADLLEAGLLRNPNIQLLLPTTTKPFELFGQFALEQFWQRPRRISAAQKQWDQIAQALLQNGLNTVRDARQAHAALLQAQARSRIAAESAELRRQIAKVTQARLRAGDVSVLDARASETDAANAIEQQHRFEHDVEIAERRLRFLVGLAPGADLRAVASPLNQNIPPAEGALIELARSSRPDLRALEIGIAAAAERGRWERSRLLMLGALLSSKRFLNNDILTGPGLSFDIPIFRSNAGGVARADAQVEQAARQYLAQRQRVELEVSESRVALVQALDSLRDWRERVLPPAAAAVEGSKNALEAGDASNLFVLETTRRYVDAQLREVDQEAAVRRSWAELERNIGTKVGGAQ